ncbi:hypothetical protein ACFX13_036934 [Malus domestica]
MEAEMVESGDKPHDFLRWVLEMEVGKWSRGRRARVKMTHLKVWPLMRSRGGYIMGLGINGEWVMEGEG